MLFSNWHRLLTILVMAILTYIAFWLMLTLAGKRSFAKLSVQDVIAGVVIGPIFATTVTSESMTLLDGVVAIGTVLVVQYLLNKLTTRFAGKVKLSRNEPALLFYNGDFMRDKMRAERLTDRDIYYILRRGGIDSIEEVQAVVLETDGSFSVVRHCAGPHDTIKSLQI